MYTPKPQIANVITFREAMEHAPENLFDTGSTRGYIVTPALAPNAPSYRTPELVGAWVQGYLAGLAAETTYDDATANTIEFDLANYPCLEDK